MRLRIPNLWKKISLYQKEGFSGKFKETGKARFWRLWFRQTDCLLWCWRRKCSIKI